MPEPVHRQLTLSPSVLERFDGHVQTDLVAELEAVGHRLFGIEDRHVHAVDRAVRDAFGQGRARHPHDAQCGLVEARVRHVGRNRQPDFEGRLGSDLVHAQGRQQADNAPIDPDRSLGQRAMLAGSMTRQAIDPSGHPLQPARMHQAAEHDGGQPVRDHIACAQQRRCPRQGQNGCLLRSGVG